MVSVLWQVLKEQPEYGWWRLVADIAIVGCLNMNSLEHIISSV